METVDCNLCGFQNGISLIAGRDRVFGLGDTFRVVRCSRCSLAYLNPRPDAKELEAYYTLEYQRSLREYPGGQGRVFKLGLNIWQRRRTPPFVPGGRVLEIGCSGGAYLRALRELGWEVHGIEIASESAQYAREQFGLDVRTGAAEDALGEFPDSHFDVITMWHVLEHLFDPSAVLLEVYRTLKPGGRLMLEVPNFGALSRFIFGTYWFPLELPRHLYHFRPKTLEPMLTKAGMRVTRIKGVPSAIAMTLSLQLLWNRCVGDLGGRRIILNPVLLCLFFPASWLLARFRLSSAMTAEAIKPASGS